MLFAPPEIRTKTWYMMRQQEIEAALNRPRTSKKRRALLSEALVEVEGKIAEFDRARAGGGDQSKNEN